MCGARAPREPVHTSAPAPPRAVRRCAEPERAAPSRRHTQARAAPFTSRADHRKPTRRAPARVGQFRHQGWHPRCNARKGRMSPAQQASSLPLSIASAQRPSTAARASREPVHTRQPLAGGLHLSAPPRPTLRRARKSRAEPQAHPDARRTFHEPRGPPETVAERARDVLHVTAGTQHSWHLLLAHTSSSLRYVTLGNSPDPEQAQGKGRVCGGHPRPPDGRCNFRRKRSGDRHN